MADEKTPEPPAVEGAVVGGPPPAEAVGKPLPVALRVVLGVLAAAATVATLTLVLWVLEQARAELGA